MFVTMASLVVMGPSGEVGSGLRTLMRAATTTVRQLILILSFTEELAKLQASRSPVRTSRMDGPGNQVEIWVIDSRANKDFCNDVVAARTMAEGNACQDSSPLTDSGSGSISKQKDKRRRDKDPELLSEYAEPISVERQKVDSGYRKA